MPVFSLPSDQSSGTLGSEAYRFVNFISRSGLTYWQILPLVPPDETGSPYRSCSAFAGGIGYIDPDILAGKAPLSARSKADDDSYADYKKSEQNISRLLKNEYKSFCGKKNRDFDIFCTENAFWLDDYAEYSAIKEHFGNIPWYEWDDEIKFRDKAALDELRKSLSCEIGYHKFCQFEFFRQWNMLKKYAASKNVRIIGDIPIYVALDSADVWAEPSLFLLDEELVPKLVAGVPPDMFSETGQLWGNPIYNWHEMEKQNFSWWKKRIRHNAMLCDMLRIDHFIGIVNYYAVPYGEPDATKGSWLNGPSMKLIEAINESCADTLIIAEDLGVVSEAVKKVMKKSGYPGMRLMEFAFDDDASSKNLPHNFPKNCIVYGGTHDNETLCGYFSHAKPKVISFAKEYLGVSKRSDIPWGIIKSAFKSTAALAVFQMQDFLALDNFARTNTPSTTENNWCFRFGSEDFSDELAAKIKKLVKISGR
ncbi:MAG: 4-alpha-glucanotransferase [Ruminococcus sp.]|nr:4-alpha-glucanotransferase [Ruminococcus sp.]